MLPVFPAHLFARLAAMSHDVTRDKILNNQKYIEYAAFLTNLEKPCNDCGLRRTAKQVRIVVDACATNQCTPLRFISLFAQIYQSLLQELEEQAFLHIPPDRIRWFKGPGANTKDPKVTGTEDAAREFHTARRCLGLNEPTACVLHLNRVIEVGAKVAAKSLGVKTEGCTIGKLANEIQSSARMLKNAGGCSSEVEEFYNALVADLFAFTRGHRNPAVHGLKQYDFVEAQDMVVIVGHFMRHLQKHIADWNNPTIPTFPLPQLTP